MEQETIIRPDYVKVELNSGTTGANKQVAYIPNKVYYANDSTELDKMMQRLAQTYTKLKGMIGK